MEEMGSRGKVVRREEFEQLVEEAVASLPQEFRDRLQNIAIIVERKPPRAILRKMGLTHTYQLLGLYHGVPYPHRGPFYGNQPPDVISIYQEPIENICRTREEIKKKVRDVVIHEIAHYFNFKDDYLKQIEGED